MAAVALDCGEVVSGPAQVELNSELRGHTQGGATVTITPSSRDVVVDQYGSAPCRLIHMGDDVKANTSLAQFVAQNLVDAYTQGVNGTTYVGIGRRAGYVLPDQQLDLTPFDSNDEGVFTMFRAVQVGEVSVQYSHENDRIIPFTWRGLPDESLTDGENIAKLFAYIPPA